MVSTRHPPVLDMPSATTCSIIIYYLIVSKHRLTSKVLIYYELHKYNALIFLFLFFSNALIFRFLGKYNALIFLLYISPITIRIGQTTSVIH